MADDRSTESAGKSAAGERSWFSTSRDAGHLVGNQFSNGKSRQRGSDGGAAEQPERRVAQSERSDTGSAAQYGRRGHGPQAGDNSESDGKEIRTRGRHAPTVALNNWEHFRLLQTRANTVYALPLSYFLFGRN